MRPIRRALISVSDKTGVIDLARVLSKKGVELLSTGGTARLLSENGINVIEVSHHTGFPEMMDGRVKTLHPKIHGGILGRRGTDDSVMQQHDIKPIDLVIVNLYPFEQTISKPNCSFADAIENIDIGGPAMVRSAAKNHDSVTIVVDPSDYERLLIEMNSCHDSVTQKTRFAFALKAFEHTSRYDGMIANYFGDLLAKEQEQRFAPTLNMQLVKKQELRYGENPHQSAAFYVEHRPPEVGVATAKQIQGKELSFNNIADTDAALECVKQFDQPACVIVKHANPCGVAVGQELLQAYNRAYQTDPTSAFGGIIAFNRELDDKTAKAIIDRQFVEVIIAPAITLLAVETLKNKANVRVLICGAWQTKPADVLDFKRVNGGLLVQDRDNGIVTRDQLKIVTHVQPTEAQINDLLFAWKVCKFVKSNAIVYARDAQTIGIGAGQMSRVYSAKIANIKAADEKLIVSGSVMASDAFFPFRDGIDAAAQAGIKAVIQPGGSMRDQEVIDAANEHGIAMVFTSMRHFRH